jgi:hypothetical protein
MLEIIKSLSWAQWGVAICSIGVVFFTLMSTVIQQREERTKTEVANELNQQILQLAHDNKRLSEEIKDANQEQFEAAISPDLRISKPIVAKEVYYISVTNHGQSTAENVMLQWVYSYATQIGTGCKELPPKQVQVFQSDVFPLDDVPAMKDAYAETKAKFATGDRALIVRLKITYDWQGATKDSPEYTLIWDGKEVFLY